MVIFFSYTSRLFSLIWMGNLQECVDFTWWVFADKLVVYSYYQDFTNQLKLENLGSSKT